MNWLWQEIHGIGQLIFVVGIMFFRARNAKPGGLFPGFYNRE